MVRMPRFAGHVRALFFGSGREVLLSNGSNTRDRVQSRVTRGEDALSMGHCLDREATDRPVPGMVSMPPALRRHARSLFLGAGVGVLLSNGSGTRDRVRSRDIRGENAWSMGHCLDRQATDRRESMPSASAMGEIFKERLQKPRADALDSIIPKCSFRVNKVIPLVRRWRVRPRSRIFLWRSASLRACLRQRGRDFLFAYPGLPPWATLCRP
jgi:hypothetical protein